MGPCEMPDVSGATGEEAVILLQSLLCMMREKNLLSRADIENLCDKVEARALQRSGDAMPCSIQGASAAAEDMKKIGGYLGRRYGGKHRRI